MPMARLLNGSAFSPDDITILSAAFEDALRTLGLTDRADPATGSLPRKSLHLRSKESVTLFD
jgi:hypothetical protein